MTYEERTRETWVKVMAAIHALKLVKSGTPEGTVATERLRHAFDEHQRVQGP